MKKINYKKSYIWYIIGAIILAAAAYIRFGGIGLQESLPYLPIEEWSGELINWLNTTCDPLFVGIAFIIKILFLPILTVLTSLPPLIIILILTSVSYLLDGWRLALFVFLLLLIVVAMGLWPETMTTLSLALTATLISLIVGIPLGIIKARSNLIKYIVDPILDFMQTMPLFVYLIPAVLFFSIGNVPGIVATFIFATPPVIRLTSLGIEQLSKEHREVGTSFGASPMQFLWKVELPLAMPSIMMGINQTIMLSLSMVVVASMIGAEGLGQEVLRGIMRLKVGQGIAGGVGIVILAMILDRMTKRVWQT
jgi:glycine betaine/proline transport system permease protein